MSDFSDESDVEDIHIPSSKRDLFCGVKEHDLLLITKKPIKSMGCKDLKDWAYRQDLDRGNISFIFAFVEKNRSSKGRNSCLNVFMDNKQVNRFDLGKTESQNGASKLFKLYAYNFESLTTNLREF